ncbi:hypothetical protein M0R45_021110 [Rubus argutus]|uniref:Uncharacterized protein n=1 Tax=Rubus argutus TaxID=59490 RepID=A0AAW1XCN3_RUBAR
MSHYTQNPGAMFTNTSDPNNRSFGTPAPSAHNGYPSYHNYAPPPQSHGYYNNQYPSQSAPAAHAPYGGYSNYLAPPPPSYNGGYYDQVSQAPVAPQSKPTSAKGSKRTSYNVSGNRVSGNKGDHNGVFNIGNKNTRYNDEEDD